MNTDTMGVYRIDLNLWRRLHIDARINLHFHRLRWFSPFRKRRDFVAVLYLMDRIIVCWIIRLSASNDPDVRRRRADPRHSCRNGPTPIGWRKKEVAGLCAGGARTGRRKYIGPHIEHRQEVISAISIRRGNDHRLFGHIEPCGGLKSIKVYSYHSFEITGRVLARAREEIHRTSAEFFTRRNVGRLFSCQIHYYQWVEVKIGVDPDGMSRVLRNRCCVRSTAAAGTTKINAAINAAIDPSFITNLPMRIFRADFAWQQNYRLFTFGENGAEETPVGPGDRSCIG